MKIINVINYFLGKDGKKKLNCAQSVLAAFKEEFPFLSEEFIKEFESHGGGNAPGGMCGALYAAKYILDKHKPGESDKLVDFFIRMGGATRCKEIKKNKKMSCLDCLKHAAGFLKGVEK